MSSKRIAFATATETLSGTCTLTSFPSRDLIDITLPSISVIVPRKRVVVWASAAFTISSPATSNTNGRFFIFSPGRGRAPSRQQRWRARCSIAHDESNILTPPHQIGCGNAAVVAQDRPGEQALRQRGGALDSAREQRCGDKIDHQKIAFPAVFEIADPGRRGRATGRRRALHGRALKAARAGRRQAARFCTPPPAYAASTGSCRRQYRCPVQRAHRERAQRRRRTVHCPETVSMSGKTTSRRRQVPSP